MTSTILFPRAKKKNYTLAAEFESKESDVTSPAHCR